MPFNSDASGAFDVSAYEDKISFELGGESKDTTYTTMAEAKAAFGKLVNGGRFFAVAYGYRGASGEFVDLDEWTKDDPA